MGTIGLRLVVPTGGWPYPTESVGYEREVQEVPEVPEVLRVRFWWFNGAGGSGVGAGATWLEHDPAASWQRRGRTLRPGWFKPGRARYLGPAAASTCFDRMPGRCSRFGSSADFDGNHCREVARTPLTSRTI